MEGMIMPDDAGGLPAQHEDRPVGQLVSDATEQITRLVRNEMRLAAAELQQRASAWASVPACSVPLVCWPSTAAQC
jgi:hypothetical protein